jgi:hypothetical protein
MASDRMIGISRFLGFWDNKARKKGNMDSATRHMDRKLGHLTVVLPSVGLMLHSLRQRLEK